MQSGASKQVSGANERANGRASGPVLTSVFFSIFDHSEIGNLRFHVGNQRPQTTISKAPDHYPKIQIGYQGHSNVQMAIHRPYQTSSSHPKAQGSSSGRQPQVAIWNPQVAIQKLEVAKLLFQVAIKRPKWPSKGP